MHASDISNVIELPRMSKGPLRFSPAALRALGALALAHPGISVNYGVDDDGDALAGISRRRGQDVALVFAGKGGRTTVADYTGATLETFGDDEAGILWTLRCEVEGGGSPWGDTQGGQHSPV